MITLAHYQEQSASWLEAHKYGILADAPGVGKTHPAIMAAAGHVLAVVPAYLIPNWQIELARCEFTDVAAIQGTPEEKQCLLKEYHTWNLMSYELSALEPYRSIVLSQRWHLVIYDEAHRLRGRNSKRTTTAYALRKQADCIWMLTGTPLVSNGGDVFPLLKICDPKKFSSYWTFVEDYCKIVVNPWAKVVKKPKDMKIFEAMLQPYMMRRTLNEVFPDIPETVETVITVELNQQVRNVYNRAKKEYLLEQPDGKTTRIEAAGLLSTLRKITAGAKISALKDLLEDIPEDEQVVIFTWHREAASLAAIALQESGYTCAGFTGDDSSAVRQHAIQEFQTGGIRILIATLATLQEGVNLQNAHYCIFMEEHWTATTNEQAEARLRRRGQKDTVLKYVITCRKTVDDGVHRAAKARGDMSLSSIFDSIWDN